MRSPNPTPIIIKNNDIQITEQLVAKLEQYTDQLPKTINPNLQMTLEVNPWLQRQATIVKNASSGATSATIYATPALINFYLCSVSLSVIKDVTATSVKTAVNATIKGTATDILAIPGITLTVQNQSATITFDKPIPIDNSTNITLTNSTNAANILANATITGFEVDPTITQTLDNN